MNTVLRVRRIFAQAPEAKALFSSVGGDDTNSGKFKAFAERQLANLDAAISVLDQPEILKAQIDYMRAIHVEKHIPEKYYGVSHFFVSYSAGINNFLIKIWGIIALEVLF